MQGLRFDVNPIGTFCIIPRSRYLPKKLAAVEVSKDVLAEATCRPESVVVKSSVFVELLVVVGNDVEKGTVRVAW